MAAATACASTALAGQSLLRKSNELARNVTLGEARVTMRKSASKSAASGSIWSVLCIWVPLSSCQAHFVVSGGSNFGEVWWEFAVYHLGCEGDLCPILD